MVEFITVVYLTFMFIALYMFSLFIILTLKNRKKLFSYPTPNTSFSVTVLIPAYNEEDSIEGTVEHVMNVDYPKEKLEAIVINDGSKDKTLEVLKKLKEKYPQLKIIDKKNSGKADSLNIGIKYAKGELIAVVDSDSFPHYDSLKKLTGFFNDAKMGAVTSFVKVRNKDKGLFPKIQSLEYLFMGWSRKLLDFVDSVYVTNGPLSLYRKEYMLKVGGFDLKTVTEDIDITWNMMNEGYKTGMCLDAHVTTIVPEKFKPWFRQRTRWGLGGLQALSKYKKLFFKRGMFGFFVMPFVSFSIIVSIATFLFTIYLFLRGLLTRSLITGYSIATDSTLITLQEINFHPSVIIFYFVVLLTLSVSYSSYIIKATNYEHLNTKKMFTMFFYILIYLTIYPVIWFASIYRFIKRDNKW